MTIIGYSFLLLFFPVCLLLYWGLFRQPKARLWFLCAASYLFYGLAGLQFVPLLLGLSLATFWLAKRKLFTLGIILNLLALGLYKYWDFSVSNLNAIADAVNLPFVIPLLQLALPLGISFYVFKHLGYLLDIKQERYPATDDFLAFATFSAFFPQISAGPISNFEDTGKQLRNLPTKLTADQVYQGLLHISVGLAKKVLIADTIGTALGSTLYVPLGTNSGLVWAWSGVFLYALQLYFDFSGYTDLVLGIGYLFGVTLPPNFNNPYRASTPSQFWQSWHMSLSLWFRLYLFTPMSRSLLRHWGSQNAAKAQYVSNLVTMGLVGLWHGAGWGYIIWGLYHGLLLDLYAWLTRRRGKLLAVISNPVPLFIAVLIGWTFFLSPDLPFAGNLLSSLFGLRGVGTFDLFAYSRPVLIAAAVASFIILSGFTEAAHLPRTRHFAYGLLFGLLAFVAILGLDQTIDFLYVQF